MNSIMDVNELFDAIRGIDLNGVIREIGRDTHILTQTEIIALAVTAAVGLLICAIVEFCFCKKITANVMAGVLQ